MRCRTGPAPRSADFGPPSFLKRDCVWILNFTSDVIQVHAQYRHFTVQSDKSSYILAVDGYSGNAGNSFMDGSLELFGVNRTMTVHNGMKFSTYDRDNDNWCVTTCSCPINRPGAIQAPRRTSLIHVCWLQESRGSFQTVFQGGWRRVVVQPLPFLQPQRPLLHGRSLYAADGQARHR